ncbi:hypothetical protein M513_01486 [Trichuris suis]|uniref:ShKT domain-containing protein n=1 Tax=Trichuris suis TaxID=68888 RepID=A0A085MKS0_9BILA|nr:hypothetical protein M513_01486 [Trichuris suis]
MDGSCGRINCKPPYTLCTVSYIAKGSQDLHYQCTNVPAGCLALVRRAHYAGNSKRRLDDASSTKFISGNDVAPVMAQPESQQAAETCEDDPSQRSAAPISSLGASILGPIYILPISGCNNGHEKCCDWASKGECSKNPVMMKTLCKQACGTCGCRAEEVMICQPAVNLISCKPPTKGPCRPKQPAAVTGAPEVVEPEQPSEAVETQPPEVHVPEETEPAPSEGVAVTEAPPEITGEPEAPTEEYRPPEAPPEETQPPEVVTEAPVPETTQVSETDVCEDGETVTEGQGIQETGEPAPAVTEAPPEVATEGAEEVTTGFPEEVFTPGEVPSEVPGGAPAEVETVAPVEVPTEVPGGAPAEVETVAPVEVPSEVPGGAPADVETVAPAEVPSEVPGGAPGEIATVPPAEVPTEPAGAECETEAPEVGTEHPETPAPGPIEETGAPEAPQPGPTEEMPVETPAPEPEGPAGPAEPAGPAGPEVEVTEEVRPETTPQPPGTVASRPLPEVTYGPPAFPTSTCPDSVVTCAFWANKGECEKNPFWMKPNCQKSCNSCGATVGTVNKPASKPVILNCLLGNVTELKKNFFCTGAAMQRLMYRTFTMDYLYILCTLLFHECLKARSSPVSETTDHFSLREESLLKQYVKYIIKAYPDECIPPKDTVWLLESEDDTCNGVKCMVPDEWCSVKTDARSREKRFSCQKLLNSCLLFLDHAILPVKRLNRDSKYEKKFPSTSMIQSDSALLENKVSNSLDEDDDEEERWKLQFLGHPEATAVTRRHELQNNRDESAAARSSDKVLSSLPVLPVVPTRQAEEEGSTTTASVYMDVGSEQSSSDGDLSPPSNLVDYMFVFGDEQRTTEPLKSTALPTKHDSSNTDCLDNHEKCSLWASAGECERNPFWMLPNCQKSCYSCGMTVGDVNTPAPVEGCFNGDELCQFWATIGECEKNPRWMKVYCQLSCNSCNEKQVG